MSVSRKLERKAQKKLGEVYPQQAMQGLSQIAAMAPQLEKFIEQSEKMEALASKFENVGELLDSLSEFQENLDRISAKWEVIENHQEDLRKSLLIVLKYFKQFFTEESSVSGVLAQVEKDLTWE